MMDTSLLLAAGDDGLVWPLYVLAGLTVVYVVVLRPMFRKGKPDPLDRPLSLGLSRQREVEQQMSSLLVEMSQMARQITGQLDTRAAKLEALIEEAERKIARLEELRQGSTRAGGVAIDSDTHVNGNGEVARPAAPAPVDPRHLAIYSLADQGRSVMQIAHELKRPHGEIELILALRPR